MKPCARVPSRWDRLSEIKNCWHTWTCPECRDARHADRILLHAARSLRQPAHLPLLEGRILDRMGLGGAGARRRAPDYRAFRPAGAGTAVLLTLVSLAVLRHQLAPNRALPAPLLCFGHPIRLPESIHQSTHRRAERGNPTGFNTERGRSAATGAGPRRRHGGPTEKSTYARRNLRWEGEFLPRTASMSTSPDRSTPCLPRGPAPVAALLPRSVLNPSPDDLAYLSPNSEASLRRWAPLPRDEWTQIEARVRRHVRLKDDFVTIPFPRIAAASDRQIAGAAESYKREAAVVDARLAHEVTCAAKGMALVDFCQQLRADTGIQLSAGPSVGDEKVTVFCEKLSLRELMRQLSRTFGYTWLRSRREGGEYQYELIQDLKSQLLEEELRNRDRNAALLALDRDMSRYQPYLTLSPDEALERSKSAGEGDKKLLETLANAGWGPIQMYFRLSPQDQAALRAGQELRFLAEPGPNERSLPADIGRGVLQSQRQVRIARSSGESGDGKGPDGGPKFHFVDANHPDASPLPPSAVPDARAGVTLKLEQTELGRFGFSGSAEVRLGGSTTGNDNGPYAIGLSPSASDPENATLNARLATDPALKGKVTVTPAGSKQRTGGRDEPGQESTPGTKHVTSADVLEALHRACGTPIVADFYTRMYAADTLTASGRPLFEALNTLSDGMRLRWSKEDGWLQFRSASFYNDRLKEVPNRLLARWSGVRREHGTLRLEDLAEIAGLSDAQLDAASMADGAKELWGLEEWDLACNRGARPHLRWIAGLTPAERAALEKPPGLRFAALSLAQQQQFIALAVGDSADSAGSLADLANATVQVDFSHAGAFEWQAPDKGNQGPEPYVPVRAASREAAFAAARRIDPQADPSQIQPTRLALMLLYQWGTPQAHGSLRLHTTGRGDTSISRNFSRNGP